MFFTKYGCSSPRMKRREGVFSPNTQKRYVCKVSCVVKNTITSSLNIAFKIIRILHTLFKQILYYKCFYDRSYSSFKTASAASFNSRLTASSRIASATLVTSSSFSASGLAVNSRGSRGGDSSAAI
jgi:hypothetical protein